MQPSSLAKRGTVLLFLAVVAFYFYGLGQIPLVGPDEPRYAQVAREMFMRGDWITPTLGGHLWFEKPVLPYWMMIVSFKLFGVTELAARLPAAVAGLLTIAAVFVVGRRVERNDLSVAPAVASGLDDGWPPAYTGGSPHGWPPAYAGGSDKNYAFWSALAAATTVGIVVFSRAASFDMVLTMTMTWALAFYVLHEVEPNEKLRGGFLAGFYIFVGLSLLAKGLIGIVIPAGVVGLFCLLQRRLPARRTILSVLWGLPLALIVAATWYGPVIARHGWPFIDQFFVQHHFARYVSDKYHHWRPFYYYLQVVPLLALPWTVFLIDGLRQFRSWLRRTDAPAAVPAADASDDRFRKLMVFARAWFLFPFLFFSFSGSKLPGYIMPILPAAALIAGERMWRLTADSTTRRWPTTWQIMTTASCGLLFAVGVLVYAWRTATVPHWLGVVVAAPFLVAGVFPFLAPRRRSVAVILLAGATVIVLVLALHWVAPAAAELESSKRLLQLADARGYSQTPIYGLQRSDRTPEFYANDRVIYGADGEPVMYEGPGGLVYDAGQRKETVLAFVPTEDVARLTAMTTAETVVIGDNSRYALVAVRAK